MTSTTVPSTVVRSTTVYRGTKLVANYEYFPPAMYTRAYSSNHVLVPVLEGPAMHLCLVLIACRSYEKKRHFTGPPSRTRSRRSATYEIRLTGTLIS